MSIIIFIIVLGILVLVHELGHFIAAKKAGCYVEEFGIGFPPKVWAKKVGETIYSLNWIPLGGYVKIQGENGDFDDESIVEGYDPSKSFSAKSLSWRALIITAGVLMNILLAYVLISITLIPGVPVVIEEGVEYGKYAQFDNREILVSQVLKNSPAESANIQARDVLLQINGESIYTAKNLQELLSTTSNTSLSIDLKRGDNVINTEATPIHIEEINSTGLGIGFTETAELSYPWWSVLWYGLVRTITILGLIIVAFYELIVGFFSSGNVSAEVTGPLGIAVLTGAIAKEGIVQLTLFTALLSLNLAIINILPIPALDGSRLLSIIIEKVRGKKHNMKYERYAHMAGFVLLMLLMVVVTIKDVYRYGGDIWQGVVNLFT